ncbi:sensor histidine kinase [Almyronema epifaneia]|uniref:histidine kinase n=1 Tax=Almyronema epifaneia S1 TaxID=2991925 RepID=A0ABW6IIW0_9CYAN
MLQTSAVSGDRACPSVMVRSAILLTLPLGFIGGIIAYLSAHHHWGIRGLSFAGLGCATLFGVWSQRWQAKALVSRTQVYYPGLFEQTPLGWGISQLEGRLIEVNESLCRLTGYSRAELIDRPLADLIVPGDRIEYQASVYTLLTQTQRSLFLERRLQTKPGKVIWVSLQATLVNSPDRPPLLSLIVQDISQHRRREQKQTEFLANISHELRTPLTAIQGSLGLLKAGIYQSHPQKANRMLEIADLECDRLVRLIDEILAFERLQTGQVLLPLQPCYAVSLLEQAARSLHAIAQNKAICYHIEPSTVQVQANPDAVLQILTNLISNAIKFSPPGSTIWLKASSLPDTQQSCRHLTRQSVVFMVQDQGCGIPSDQRSVIFERFHQIHPSGVAAAPGTGLGLAICKSLVEQQGGKIWVNSQVNQGSTFFFTLPLSNGEKNFDY